MWFRYGFFIVVVFGAARLCAQPGMDEAHEILFHSFGRTQTCFDDLYRGLFSRAEAGILEGDSVEVSPGRLAAYIQWFGRLELLRQAFGCPSRMAIPRDLAPKYAKALDYLLALRTPQGSWFPFNDQPAGMAESWDSGALNEAYAFFGHSAYRWLVSGGREGIAPSTVSYPDGAQTASHAGIYVMREGWWAEALSLAADFGGLRKFGHAGDGNFVLQAHGVDWITEGGGDETASELGGAYARSAWAHNVVTVDGLTPSAGACPLIRAPMTAVWVTNDVFDYVQGSFALEGDTPEGLRGMIYRRGILYVKPAYYVLLDAVEEGMGPHAVRNHLQLSPGVSCAVEGNRVIARNPRGAALSIVPLDIRPAPEIITGQKEPEWRGWVCSDGAVFEPAPAVTYTQNVQPPMHWATVLYPQSGAESLPVEVRASPADEGSNQGIMAVINPGAPNCQDVLLFNFMGGSATYNRRKMVLVGQCAILRREGNRIAQLALIDTRVFSYQGRGSHWMLLFQMPFTGYLTFETSNPLASAWIYPDPVLQKSTIRVKTRIGKEAPESHEVQVGRESPL